MSRGITGTVGRVYQHQRWDSTVVSCVCVVATSAIFIREREREIGRWRRFDLLKTADAPRGKKGKMLGLQQCMVRCVEYYMLP